MALGVGALLVARALDKPLQEPLAAALLGASVAVALEAAPLHALLLAAAQEVVVAVDLEVPKSWVTPLV